MSKTDAQIRRELIALVISDVLVSGNLKGAKKALEEEKKKAKKVIHKYPVNPKVSGVSERVEAQVRIDEANRLLSFIKGIHEDLGEIFTLLEIPTEQKRRRK